MAATQALLLLALVAGSWAFSGEFAHLYPDSRIVGGEIAPAGEAPFAVSLQTGTWIRSHFCGGSLVSSRYIVTAAHCIDAVYSSLLGSLLRSLTGYIGSQSTSSGGTAYAISSNITHPNWLTSQIKNDIALLRTNNEVVLSDNVQVIPLNYNVLPGGEAVTVSGWGRVVVGGSTSTQLKRLQTTVLSQDDCADLRLEAISNSNINAPLIEKHIEICTFHSAGNGNCHGDSGSALYDADRTQVGVVSWGFPCAVGAPDVYARVSGFSSWLQENIDN